MPDDRGNDRLLPDSIPPEKLDIRRPANLFICLLYYLVNLNPRRKRVVNVSGLLPFCFNFTFAHRTTGTNRDKDCHQSTNENGGYVPGQHGVLLASVFDKVGRCQTSWILTSIRQPNDHTTNTATHHSWYHSVRRGSGPDDGQCNRDHTGCNQDASEVIRPGQIQVDSPTKQAKGNRHECAQNDAPVLVAQELFLVGLVVLVDGTCVVRFDQSFCFGPGQVVLMATLAFSSTWARASFSGFILGVNDFGGLGTNDAVTRLQVLPEGLNIGLVSKRDSTLANVKYHYY